jgi:hypothetical protein
MQQTVVDAGIAALLTLNFQTRVAPRKALAFRTRLLARLALESTVSSLHRIRSAETLARASHASPHGLSTELPNHVTCGVMEHTLGAKSPSYRLPENQLGIGTVTQGPWPGEFQNGHDGFHAYACAPPPLVPAC